MGKGFWLMKGRAMMLLACLICWIFAAHIAMIAHDKMHNGSEVWRVILAIVVAIMHVWFGFSALAYADKKADEYLDEQAKRLFR